MVLWPSLALDPLAAGVCLGELATGRVDDAVCRRSTKCRVVLSESSALLPLFAHKNQMLSVMWGALLVLDVGYDILDVVTGLNLKGDGLACQNLHKDLHLCIPVEEKEWNYIS